MATLTEMLGHALAEVVKQSQYAVNEEGMCMYSTQGSHCIIGKLLHLYAPEVLAKVANPCGGFSYKRVGAIIRDRPEWFDKFPKEEGSTSTLIMMQCTHDSIAVHGKTPKLEDWHAAIGHTEIYKHAKSLL